MGLLVLGVILWCGVHLMPTLARPLRQQIIDTVGDGPYKGIVALSLVTSIILMVIGWRSATPEALYQPPTWAYAAARPLMLLALFLFAAAGVKTNVKRFIRHPQLTGVAVWAGSHLLSNGDTRSLVLFGGMGLWALVEIGLISQRQGAWERPAPEPLTAELKPVFACVVAFAVLFVLHPYLFGVSAG